MASKRKHRLEKLGSALAGICAILFFVKAWLIDLPDWLLEIAFVGVAGGIVLWAVGFLLRKLTKNSQ